MSNTPSENTKKLEDISTPAPVLEKKLDGKIVDISKWQGNINFDKLKNDVSLVIARASCGSDKDIKIPKEDIFEFGQSLFWKKWRNSVEEDKIFWKLNENNIRKRK